ncbi:MAG: hypothetical protein QOH55_773 [Microbacteriaceae bacterium]|jgi:hypothetical protein|nr:hypothetical protein [Microbacteriaceae bacterium]
MFGLRRHAASVKAAPVLQVLQVPQLSEKQIFELIHARLAEFVGENGSWTVSARTDADSDTIFHGILARSVALGITADIRVAQEKLEAGDLVEVGAHVAPVLEAVADLDEHGDHDEHADRDRNAEPAAFGWQPAPITVWTDLRKPVTGEIPQVLEPALVA